MKFLVKFEPTNKRVNPRGASILHGATIPIEITEEIATANIKDLLPDAFKQYIEEITSVTVNGKEYVNTTFPITQGGFIVLKVTMPTA
jgi:hypothetical protein